MTLNWLYGPKVLERRPDMVQVRSLVLEPDTIRSLHELVASRAGQAELVHIDDEGNRQPFGLGRLDEAPDWQRRRLHLVGGPSWHDFAIDLRHGMQPCIYWAPDGTGRFEELGEEVASRLLNEGRPRIMWKPQLIRLPWVGYALLAAAWAWFCVESQPPWSLILAGSLLVVATAVTTARATELVRERVGSGFPGHIIRTMSRQDIRSQRAERHANLKLAAITIPLGALVGAGATWIFK